MEDRNNKKYNPRDRPAKAKNWGTLLCRYIFAASNFSIVQCTKARTQTYTKLRVCISPTVIPVNRHVLYPSCFYLFSPSDRRPHSLNNCPGQTPPPLSAPSVIIHATPRYRLAFSAPHHTLNISKLPPKLPANCSASTPVLTFHPGPLAIIL